MGVEWCREAGVVTMVEAKAKQQQLLRRTIEMSRRPPFSGGHLERVVMEKLGYRGGDRSKSMKTMRRTGV